jgi:RNA polymerase sigma-70 factor, ECF subfamily
MGKPTTSTPEIAASTDMPVGTVKVYLSRARTTLAALLDNDERDITDVVVTYS